MANRIAVIFSGLAKDFFRSPGAVFWTVAFPVMLILIFGAIFAGSGTSSFDLYVQDQDNTPESKLYIGFLESTGVLNIREVPAREDADQFIESNSVTNLLIIPDGFGDRLTAMSPVEVTLRQDSTSGGATIVLTAVNAVTQQINLNITGGSNVIIVQTGSIVSDDFNFIDFFLPGTIGLMVMMIAVQSIVGYQTRFRNNGIFRKLSTTPMNNWEWLVGMMAWMLVMVAITVAAIMITGILVYGVQMTLGPMAIAIIVVATLLFTAIGMIISQFVKDEEVAGTAAGAITFPMMFLSGSFFPLESMPQYLQTVAQVLPLTYVNNGLRDVMVYNNGAGGVENLLILIAITAAVVLITVAISGWKKE